MMMFKLNKLLFVSLCTVLLYSLGVTGVFAKDYSFSWSANAEPVEGYKLYYKQGGATAPTFDEIVGDAAPFSIELGKVTSFTVTGLLDNTTYHFALTAYNGSEESDYTDVITVFSDGTLDSLSASINVHSQAGEAPFTVNFDGSGSTGSITSYSWAFGDDVTGNGMSTSYTYQNSGTYTAVLTINDGAGQTEQTSVDITVSEPPPTDPPVAAMSVAANSGEAPLTINFDGSGSTSVVPPILSYNWNFGDNTAGSGTSVAHIYNDPGVYTAVLTVEDSNGVSEEVSTTITVTEVTLPDPPVADISVSVSTGSVPLDVTLSASGSTGTISSYSWDFGDDSSAGSGESVEHTYDVAGNYTVLLTVSDAAGQTSQKSKVIVASEPVAGGASYQFSWSANAEPIEGYRLYYKKGGSAGLPYGGAEATEGVSPIDLGKVTSFTITGLEDNTTYHFTLTAYNGSEESDFTDVITVFPGVTSEPLVAIISVDSQTGEAPLALNFDASNSTGSISGYAWAFGDGGTGAGSSTSYTYQNTGTYTAVLTVDDGAGQTEQASVNITVSDPPPTDPPVAAITASVTSGEAPLTVNFDGNGSTSVVPPISSYNWSFGDSSTGSGASTKHVYNQPGIYTAVLMVEDSNGVSEEVSETITVSEPAPSDPPVASMSASVVSGEAPLTVSFSGSGSTSVVPPISSYNWSFGDSSTGSGASVNHIYNQPGMYTAVLTVEDDNGVSERVSTTITVAEVTLPDPPMADISASVSSGPIPLNVTFTGSGSTGTISSYSWNFGDNSSMGSGETTTHIYDMAGTYNVILTVSDGEGQTSQRSVVIVANDAITAGASYPFSWSANAEPVEGYKLYYKKGGFAGPPFDGTDATEGVSPIDLGKVTSFTITGLEDNATYHFALTAYNGSEESDFTDVITVFPDLMPLSADISVDSQTGEAPLTVNFDGSSSTGAVSSYLWNFGDGDTAEGINVSHIYDSIGTYTATLVASDTNGDSSQESVEIELVQLASGDLTPPVAEISTAGAEGVVPFTASFNGEASTSAPGTSITSYEWDFGDGSDTQYGLSVEHYFSQSATYTVSLTVTDSAGQTGEAFVFVNANAASAGGGNTVPIAQFSKSSSSGVVPLSVSFDAFGSSDPDGDRLDYVWSFGDGATAAGEVSEHTFNDPGSYTVELFVEDEFGATASSRQTITVLTVEEYEEIKKKRIQVINIIINTLLLGEEEQDIVPEEVVE